MEMGMGIVDIAANQTNNNYCHIVLKVLLCRPCKRMRLQYSSVVVGFAHNTKWAPSPTPRLVNSDLENAGMNSIPFAMHSVLVSNTGISAVSISIPISNSHHHLHFHPIITTFSPSLLPKPLLITFWNICRNNANESSGDSCQYEVTIAIAITIPF